MKPSAGIYVEIQIRGTLDEAWRLTQNPAHHQRWDLRFTEIRYLPRAAHSEPQRFLYETRVGFGLKVTGTGESVAQRPSTAEPAASSLRFASDDPKSLIRVGSGYWRYVPSADGVRFFTWYDYEVRFGRAGQLIDRLCFRPLMDWATAWSFDRLRRWVEDGQPPEVSIGFALIHGLARLGVAAIWIWHGLVPKVLYRHFDELTLLRDAGLPAKVLPWIGAAEIVFGVLVLILWNDPRILLATAAAMVAATIAVALNSPAYLVAAFNPVTLNFAMTLLSLLGWLACRYTPSARHCRRRQPKEPR